MKRALYAVCAAVLLLWCTAALAQESALEGALRQSQWQSYVPVTETQDGALAAGIVLDGATGHAALAIAQEEHGAFSLIAFYEKLIPQQVELAEMRLEAYDAGGGSWSVPVVTLQFPSAGEESKNYVRLICPDGEWQLDMMLGEANGARFSLMNLLERKQLSIVRIGEEYDALCALDAIDLSPQGFSYAEALAQAGPLFDAYTRQRKETVMTMIQHAFPDEDWTDCELIAWNLWDDEEKAAAAAVIDRMQSRVTYFADTFSPAGGVVMHNLFPLFAEEESIRVSVPHPYDENPDANFPAYLEFETPLGERYSVEMTRGADNRLRVRTISYTPNENEFFSGKNRGNRLEVYCSTEKETVELIAALPESFHTLAAFSPNAVGAHMVNAVQAFRMGEAPMIPDDEESAFRLPQPCAAELKRGKHDVYSGPGRHYYREANGKACVSTNDWIQVFGRVGEWALVQYRVDGPLLRFGYVHLSALKAPETVPELRFEAAQIAQDNQFVTSNPLGVGGEIELTDDVTGMTRLCTMGEKWMYVELMLPNGQTARMFAEIEPSHG